ncbi:TonB-dependent receptor [Caulobacter sp. 17J80-11]|uniref:TonB-dependent receptor n=1 Tax=Caulobacter sp. 17J80-11 TaxID=2763502 RepID=UPI00165374B6|nr:TonB-dependent receptor [Caulobacter sp. 17J80-11]MBC6982432.1 TonB-dependent receptor [Caulobacter sp. 17J80-11]
MGIRRSMWIASASALTLAFAAPAFAQEQASDVDEVVVTGIRASLQQSIQSKRNADAVVEVITAEDVGKFPDKNVAESLQRVTGVSITRDFGEGERVSIRGTASNLNLTLLNGHGVATADWFILDQLNASRSFNYLMLPSEIVGRVEVFKSPQASLEEGGVGGTVDVRTRKPLDLDPLTVSASAQMAYSEKADEWDPQLSGMLSWSNEADTFGVMIGLISQKRHLRRDGVEVLGYGNANFGGAIGQVDYPSLIGSSFFQQERDRKGVNFAVQFRPNDQVDVNLTGLYSHMDADNFNQNYMAWISNKVGAGAVLTGAQVEDDTLVKGTFATAGGYGAVFDAIDRQASTETRSIDLDGKFRPNELWTLHGQIGFTDAEGATEAQSFWETIAQTGVSFDLTQGVPRVSFADIDPTDPAALNELGWAAFDNIVNNDSEFYARGDVERKVDFGPFVAVKAGLKYTNHERETSHIVGRYPTLYPWAGGSCGTPPHACGLADVAGSQTPSDYLDGIAGPGVLSAYAQVNPAALRALILGKPLTPWSPSLPAGTDFSEMYPNDSYTITEKAFGGFVMGEFEGDGYRGNVGVRIVQTDQTAQGWAVGAGGGADNAFGDITRVEFDNSYLDILPSLNIAFDLTDDLVLRFAAAKVMARPDYAKIAPQVSLTPSIYTGTGGNPELDPYRASQFDASLEWYYGKESLLAVSAFYKDIQSYLINETTDEIQRVETNTPDMSRCTLISGNQYNCHFDITRPRNGSGGRNQGIEISWQQPVWNGFGVQANYTYSDAEALNGDPIPGNSDHSLNLTGYYENERVSARLAYNYRSAFFVDIDRAAPLNSEATQSLDASASLNLTENIALTFDAQNLTDETLEFYSRTKARPRAFYKNGRVFYVGARVNF